MAKEKPIDGSKKPKSGSGPFASVAKTLSGQGVPEHLKEPSLRARVLKLLKDELRINVESGGFTEPNNRIISVKFGDHIVCKETFDVTQRREYEG